MPASLILIAATLLAADLKVDHITIAGRDLKQLQSAFGAAGIRSEFGGKHSNGLTEMAIASFPDGSYLELIAAQASTGAAAHYWGRFIDADGGPCAWAVSVPDIASGGVGGHPIKSGRLRPDGVALEWESASVGPQPQGTFFPFLIHDLTPREHRAFPHGKPSAPNFGGVAWVVIGVRDLDAAIEHYRKTFHLAAPQKQDDLELQLHLAAFAGTPVVLASPTGSKSPLTARLGNFGEAPYLFVLDQGKASATGSLWFGWHVTWNLPLGIGIRH